MHERVVTRCACVDDKDTYALKYALKPLSSYASVLRMLQDNVGIPKGHATEKRLDST